MFKEVLLSSEALKPKLDRCLKVCRCFVLKHAQCMYRCIAVQTSRSQLITPFIGQSIFTLFSSLAWAFHFLIKLLKKTLLTEKKGITISVICENFSPVYRIVSEKLSLKKLKSLKKCMSSLTVLLPNNFAISNGGYFLCCCLQRAKSCTNCSN